MVANRIEWSFLQEELSASVAILALEWSHSIVEKVNKHNKVLPRDNSSVSIKYNSSPVLEKPTSW